MPTTRPPLLRNYPRDGGHQAGAEAMSSSPSRAGPAVRGHVGVVGGW